MRSIILMSLLFAITISCGGTDKTINPQPDQGQNTKPNPDPDPDPIPGPTTIELAKVFGDNMVLQQEANANIWGKGRPETKINITPSWNNKKYSTYSDKDGNWMLQVETPKASNTPHKIVIYDGTELELKNVLVGEVWICSGQSNMATSLSGTWDSWRVPHAGGWTTLKLQTIDTPDETPPAGAKYRGITGWQNSSPETAGPFSCIGYIFGITIIQKMNIPVGMINTSRSGATIQRFMTSESIRNIPNINHNLPGAIQDIYNTRICPIKHYTARGVLWYQGEGNQSIPQDYPKLFKSMVELWRDKDHWNNDKMPFYTVQIAPYGNATAIGLPLFVECQVKASREIPYVGIASTTDVGAAKDLHPGNKGPVAGRLAWMALRDVYNITEGIPLETPLYKSMVINGSTIVVSFDNIVAPNDIFAVNDEIVGFEIAGSNKIFSDAKATITDGGTTITVSSPNVVSPVAVRYSFRNFKPGNLKTKAGQPVVCFRTDSW